MKTTFCQISHPDPASLEMNTFLKIFLILIALNSCGKSSNNNRFTIYIGHEFNGEAVTIKVDGKYAFYGKVISNRSSQLAAIIYNINSNSVCDFQINVTQGDGGNKSFSETVNIINGKHIIVMLNKDGLILQQQLNKPDYY